VTQSKKLKTKDGAQRSFLNIQIEGGHECNEFWDTVLRRLESSLPKHDDVGFVKKLFPGVDIPVVCCIDEAHELITQRKGNDTYFVLWRRQIRNVSWNGFFNILLSTKGRLAISFLQRQKIPSLPDHLISKYFLRI
jgi:hypothetical protein